MKSIQPSPFSISHTSLTTTPPLTGKTSSFFDKTIPPTPTATARKKTQKIPPPPLLQPYETPNPSVTHNDSHHIAETTTIPSSNKNHPLPLPAPNVHPPLELINQPLSQLNHPTTPTNTTTHLSNLHTIDLSEPFPLDQSTIFNPTTVLPTTLPHHATPDPTRTHDTLILSTIQTMQPTSVPTYPHTKLSATHIRPTT